MQFYFIFLFLFFFCFLFLFPHKTGGVCKCASAIWTLSGVWVFFVEEWQASQHHMDKILLLDLCFVVVGPDDQLWSGGGGEKKKPRMGSVLWRTECRAAEP